MGEVGMHWYKIRLASLLAFSLMLSNISVKAMQEDAPSVAPPGTVPLALKEFNEGLVLFNQGKYAEASEKYADVVRLAPNFPEAHMMYGVGLLKTGQVSEAETELVKANTMKPD